MFIDLNDENFIMYAMKAYDSPYCIVSEFEEDLKRTKYLKRLFRRYKVTGDIKHQLILNHIICLYNIFGVEAATRILFFKIDTKDYDVLKTFLLFLNYMPDKILGIKGKDITSSDISVDLKVANMLRKI
jgi:hypothetical protein